jgi:two-component system response regulator HydG
MSEVRKPRVLVVDDRPEMAETLADSLVDHGYDAIAMPSSREALSRIEEPLDALITDLRMPGVDGLELLTASRRAAPDRPVIVMTAFGAVDTAVESIRRGAYHYLTKPFKMDELLLFLERALGDAQLRRESRALRATLGERFGFGNVVGKSAAMRRAVDVAARVAATSAPVLLLGETGTGKGLFARAIHGASPRAASAFVAVNCAALPEALLESELFGHVKGAFTGAVAERAGLFVEADGGTLFLDEIGEMTPALQAKLLRALEDGKVRPVGASKERAVNVRLLAATHRELRERVKDGSFREDLLYRLEDLSDLIAHFLAEAKSRHPSSPVERISTAALSRLLDHRWPGNLRELSHAIERIVLLGQGAEAAAVDLPPMVFAPHGSSASGPPLGDEVLPIREVQRRYAAWALEKCGNHRTSTAERLGVDGKTLARWLSAADDKH